MAIVLLFARSPPAIHGGISMYRWCSRLELRFAFSCSNLQLEHQLRFFTATGCQIETQKKHWDSRVEKKITGRKLEAQLCSGVRVGEGSLLCTGSSRHGHDLGRLGEQGELGKSLDIVLGMDQQAAVASVPTYRSLFIACGKRKDLAQAKRVYAHLVKQGPQFAKLLGDYVVSTLVKCGGLEDALQAFQILPHRSVYSWTAIISGYANAAKGQEALRCYQWMREEGVQPSASTFVSLLKACGTVEEGKRIHAEVWKYRFEGDLFVATCLVDMYAKCGSILDAQNVFDGLFQRDVVSWNAMLSAYVEHGQEQRALQLYEQMWEDGVSPDVRTFVSILQGCGLLSEKEEGVVVGGTRIKAQSLEQGRIIHADAESRDYVSCVFVGNTLISMYGKCGSIVDAQIVFDGLPERTVVSWNALVAAYGQQGQPEAALQVYEQMVHEQVSPTDRTFVTVLQVCGMLAETEDVSTVSGQRIKVNTMKEGKAIHADALRRGYATDVFVGSTLVSMYAKCGSILDAGHVFHGLSCRTVVSWNAMIAAYAQQGPADMTLHLHEQMCEEGVSPDVCTTVGTLQACGVLAETKSADERQKILGIGKVMHAYAWCKGYNLDVFVGNSLVSMYGKCGSVVDAWNVFNGLYQRNVVAWTAMLAAHVEQDQAKEAWLLYQQMQEEGCSPDDHTFVSALQACVLLAQNDEAIVVGGHALKARSLEMGKLLQAYSQSNMFDLNIFVGSTLVSLYGKCGSSLDARVVFDRLSKSDVVLWNAMLVAYTDDGRTEKALQLFEQMGEQGISPDVQTFVTTLQACGKLGEAELDVVVDGLSIKVKSLGAGKALHADLQRRGYHSNNLVGNTLVSMYRKCGSIVDAQGVFDQLPDRDVVTWTAMLAAYTHKGQGDKALQLYRRMQDEGVSPNHMTFVTALQACSMLAEREVADDGRSTKQGSLVIGREIHADVQRKGLDSDVFVGNSLVSMYRKCRSIGDVQNAFDRLSHRDVVSWNAILAAYAEIGQAETSFKLYEQMQQASVSPNVCTFVTLVQACSLLAEKEGVGSGSIAVKALEKAREIHSDIKRKGYDSDVFIGSSLISMYGRSRSIQDAWSVFKGLSHRDTPIWNAMLSAYVEQGHAEEAWQLYMQMEREGATPDDITFVCILQVCSSRGSLAILRQIHHTVASKGRTDMSPFLASTLISAYGRCASMKDGQSVFDALSQPDIVSWNALISGYARQGNWAASFEVYDTMLLAGVEPNGVTFLSLLSACSHAGLVDTGVEYFESMNSHHGMIPGIEHYVTMVDLLGRAGYFTKVEQLLSNMPVEPNLAMWLCLLAACRKHGKVTLGRRAFDRAVRLQPTYAATYVLMLNIYTDVGLWDRAKEVKALRQKAAGWKKPGQTWVENEEQVHSFVVRDHKHPEQEQMYDLLGKVRELHEHEGHNLLTEHL